MARSKKKAAKARRARPAAKKAPKKRAKKGARKAAKAPAGVGSDVQQRWQEYWECRQALEAAVDAVREADARLEEARAHEKERRAVFDQTKNSLRDLLEVEPAGGSRRGSGSSSASLFDAGARLGVVDPAEDAEEDEEDEDDADEG